MPRILTVGSVEMGDAAVSVEVRSPELSFPVSMRVADATIGRELDFLVPLTLLPAMKAGTRLSLPGPVSPRLLAGAATVQSIFSLWDDGYKRVPVEAEARAGAPASPEGVGCFFSGGVDSTFTVLRHLPEISHLIFINSGFDRLSTDALENARAVAKELGKPLLEVETNLRSFSNAFALDFGYYGGAALATVALLFQHLFHRVLVASSFSYAALPRRGIHPLIEPLWSTEGLEVVHDGSDVMRPMKLASLAENDVAMRHLRVCYRGGAEASDGSGELNCGECLKCVRTMVNLRAAGALGRWRSLPDTLDLQAVAELPIHDDRDLAFLVENIRLVEAIGSDEELAAALRSSLMKHYSSLEPTAAVELDDALLLRRRWHQADRVARKRERELRELRSSFSWRVTAPLRALGRLLSSRRRLRRST